MSETVAAQAQLPGMQVSGFWRRVGAFFVDVLLLGMLGFGSGFFLFAFYMSLGLAGLLVGLAVATAYFGLLSSQVGGGQTLGMRIMGLRVVDQAGLLLSPGRSILRYLLLAFPFFFFKALADGLAPNIWVNALLMVPVMAAFASFVYLLAFNRGTGQLAHDLVMGTYVMRRTSSVPAQSPVVWRGHLAAVGVLCLLSIGWAFTPILTRFSIFRETAAVRQAILNTHEAQAARVFGGTTSVTRGAGESTRVLTILVHLRQAPKSSEAFAAQFAEIALRTDPVVSSYHRIDVSVSWGYDIGIASGVVTDQFQRTPDEWKATTHL